MLNKLMSTLQGKQIMAKFFAVKINLKSETNSRIINFTYEQ